MNNKNQWIWADLAIILVVATGVLSTITGCDSADTNSKEIIIAPAVANLSSGRGAGVVFAVDNAIGGTFTTSTSTSTNGNTSSTSTTATSTSTNQTLFYPLEWSVSTPSLGTIRSASGNTAVYESLGGEGNNIITVRDQDDNKGQAVVVQRAQ